jgi:hypothetical protein
MTWTTDPNIRAMVREHTEHEEKHGMTWTREHDRVIAKRCENAKPRKERGVPKCLWGYEFPDSGFRSVPNYSTDLIAVIRAAEAWRSGDKGRRTWLIESPHSHDEDSHVMLQQGYSHDAVFHGYGPTPAAALAHALYQAVTA